MGLTFERYEEDMNGNATLKKKEKLHKGQLSASLLTEKDAIFIFSYDIKCTFFFSSSIISIIPIRTCTTKAGCLVTKRGSPRERESI